MNLYVEEGDNYEEMQGQVFMLCMAIRYRKAGNDLELSCLNDAEAIMELATQYCDIPTENVTFLKNKGANREGLTQAAQNIGSRMQAGDTFIFYFSGHGAPVGQVDQTALALMKGDGSGGIVNFMDSEVASLISSVVPQGGKFLMLADCCHSGTICNFEQSCWGNLEAMCLAGCKDEQTSTDTGRGGIFTTSMLLALNKLNIKNGDDDTYSVGCLFNAMLKEGEQVMDTQLLEQDFGLTASRAIRDPSCMEWPLRPTRHYTVGENNRMTLGMQQLAEGNLQCGSASITRHIGLASAGLRQGKLQFVH
jgi:hypothetical protein